MTSTETNSREIEHVKLLDGTISRKRKRKGSSSSLSSLSSIGSSYWDDHATPQSRLQESPPLSSHSPPLPSLQSLNSLSSDDEVEIQRMKSEHKQVLLRMNSLRERFDVAKEAYIRSETEKIIEEEKLLRKGTHQGYVTLLERLEEERHESIRLAQVQRKIKKEEIFRLFEADEKYYWDEFWYRKRQLRKRMENQIQSTISKLNKEYSELNTRILDVPVLVKRTKIKPKPSTSLTRIIASTNLNSLSQREMEDDLLKIGIVRQIQKQISKLNSNIPPPTTPPNPYRSPMSRAALLYEKINSTPTRRIRMEDVLE